MLLLNKLHDYIIACVSKVILQILTFAIIGITLFYKLCPECGMTYRYQEFKDGLHNFDDHHCFTLSFMVFLRAFVQVSLKKENQKISFPRSCTYNCPFSFNCLN